MPYFEHWKELNPTLAYDIEPKCAGVFHRLVVVLPYTCAFLPNMLNVFGLDAGFMPKVPLKGLSAQELQTLLGEKELRPIASDRQYALSNLTLSIVTGMTLDHNRILLAYCLSYGENADDTRFFLEFLRDNGGGAIDSAKNVVMSDRGACAGPVDEVFTSVIHHFCPKHLERNLKAAHYEKWIVDTFWEARGAKDKKTYEATMKKMEKRSARGKEAAQYLRGIPKWQLYLIIEMHAVLHELQSDNLVECFFSTCKEARCQASPVFVANYLAETALDTIFTAQKATPHTGYLTPRAWKLSLKYYELSRVYVSKQVSLAQYVVSHQSASKKKSDKYNVDISAKTCSCHHWQQSGCPCAHAWRVIAPGDIVFDPRYYYEFCLVSRLQAMFTNYKAMKVVNMKDVKNLAETEKYPTITPRTELIAVSGVSAKRIRSTGDVAAGGGLSQAALERMKKKACPYCNKHIAIGNEKHAYGGACVKHAKTKKAGSLHRNKCVAPYYVSRAAIVPVVDSTVGNVSDDGGCPELVPADSSDSDSERE